MLIALLLPLQGFGGMAPCNERVSTSISAAAPAVQHSCAHANMAIHQHNCSHACCGAAMVLTAATFIAPRHRPAEITSAGVEPAPDGAVERLDRPPRFIPA